MSSSGITSYPFHQAGDCTLPSNFFDSLRTLVLQFGIPKSTILNYKFLCSFIEILDSIRKFIYIRDYIDKDFVIMVLQNIRDLDLTKDVKYFLVESYLNTKIDMELFFDILDDPELYEWLADTILFNIGRDEFQFRYFKPGYFQQLTYQMLKEYPEIVWQVYNILAERYKIEKQDRALEIIFRMFKRIKSKVRYNPEDKFLRIIAKLKGRSFDELSAKFFARYSQY